ncbi:CpaD family pilus assembly protein [Terrarubrum flagellatum]|uniref:CpaD family pilus assembly protein n=1 Tax=Terrirubrum flagellatum TaxID=2895980 RepID=UPI00314507C4
MNSLSFTRFILAAGIGAFAAACAREAPQYTASTPIEYQDRHPIVVAPAEEGIDIFVRGVSSKLDLRQTLELRAAANDYRMNGQGQMAILAPTGPYGAPHRKVALVRAALASAGVTGVRQSTYRVEGSPEEQPIRVVYTKLKARVATKCGQWPHDVVGFQGTRSWNSEPYYNYGCAYQSMLANQVADPLDLVRGRTEDAIDTTRRVNAIGKQRDGQDPSTEYKTKATAISQGVGAN